MWRILWKTIPTLTLVSLRTVSCSLVSRFWSLENVKYGKYRTQYYHALGKLLFMEIKDQNMNSAQGRTILVKDIFFCSAAVHFCSFMAPLESVTDQLLAVGSTSVDQLRTEQFKYKLIGLCRDLRGNFSIKVNRVLLFRHSSSLQWYRVLQPTFWLVG